MTSPTAAVAGPVAPRPAPTAGIVPAPGFQAALSNASSGKSGLVFPVAGQTKLEPHWDGSKAIDLPAPIGTPVKAVVSGTARTSWSDLAGNQLIIDGDDGRQYYYAHLDKPGVSGRVSAGQQIGEVGCTGSACTGPHLHFAISKSGFGYGQIGGSGDIDPLPELQAAYSGQGSAPASQTRVAVSPKPAPDVTALLRLLGSGSGLGAAIPGLLGGLTGNAASPVMMLALVKAIDSATARLTGESTGNPAGQKAQGGGLTAGTPFAREISAAAAKHGVPEALIAAVARAESNFDPKAKSPAGAMGVMQLMPGTAASLGVNDPWNPSANIDGGTRYLRQLMERYGSDLDRVIQAYNAGPGAVDRFNGRVPFAETQAYLSKVRKYIADFNWSQARRGVLA